MVHEVPVSDGGTFDRRDVGKLVDKGELTEQYIDAELPQRVPGQAMAESMEEPLGIDEFNKGPQGWDKVGGHEPPIDWGYDIM